MEVKIEITPEELDRYIQYEKLLRQNPCFDRCDVTQRSTCCGYPTRSECDKKSKALNIDDYEKAGVIADFARAFVSYTEIKNEYNKARTKMNKAKKQLDFLRNQFSVTLQ